MEADDADRYRAPALDKGLDILELLASVEEGLTQAEIAKTSRSQPQRILSHARPPRPTRLRHQAGGRSVHPHAQSFSGCRNCMRRRAAWLPFATPLMRELAQRTKQANHLGRL